MTSRLLYVATDQTVPGTLGGSTHVQAVAEGLATRGHEVHVATRPGGEFPAGSVVWHAMTPPLDRPELRWTRARAILALARRIGATTIMERYYNFGGEGIVAARRLGVPAVLEVNAPIVDYPGSTKGKVDRALLVEPMRRWRDWQCRHTDLFVTPVAGILPEWVDRARVLEVEWGADVRQFHPGAGPAVESLEANRIWCVFAGAFRSWHGASRLSSAISRLHASGDDRFGALLIGDGPERASAERAAADVPGVRFTGAMAHDRLPGALAGAHIGVAPFEPMRHAALQLGFYWSPLKVFEYMASGLPVVAPALPRLQRLVRDGEEGLLYDPDDPRGLDRAIVALADPALRARLGAAARARVVRDFSWDAHCAALDLRLRALTVRSA
jgi:glycosyltransferase involved in cell wall biosynthesis